MQFNLHRRELLPTDGAVGLASGAGVVLTVLSDLDMAGAPALRQAVVAEVTSGTRLLVLDLTAIDFLDSAGLGAVVGGLRRLRAHDGDLMVVCPEPRIRRVFESCDLDRVFVLHPDVGSAIAAVIAAGERASV
ncbi:MAG: STAS domain-containing protein [Acidimicrobiales bacterium]|nr:STAS domain-containing protein [Acidimicrobiales bacterium]